MRTVTRDSFPHIMFCVFRAIAVYWYSISTKLIALWWGVHLGRGCKFIGYPFFKRYPDSQIVFGSGCKFNSLPTSNYIGINRPCMMSTLNKNAILKIGNNCGFSGTVIACALSVTLGDSVRCGANTLINDTDWHRDDFRSGLDAPIVIGDNVWLGANVTVLKGVSIGNNTLVASGSIVTKSLPANVVAVGVPAKPVKILDESVIS